MDPRDARPAWQDTLFELPRALGEGSRLFWALGSLLRELPAGDGRPVMVVPGYGAGDLVMGPMRIFLERLGYRAQGANIGRNVERADAPIKRIEDAVRFRDEMADMLSEQIRTTHSITGEPVSLVGWSMGGLLSVDAIGRSPGCIRSVVTLGSPFGDPRATAIWDLLARYSGSEVPVEEQDFSGWLGRARVAVPDVPVTVVYSRRDGIVGASSARMEEHPAVEHVEVDSSHIGFSMNAEVYRAVAEALG